MNDILLAVSKAFSWTDGWAPRGAHRILSPATESIRRMGSSLAPRQRKNFLALAGTCQEYTDPLPLPCLSFSPERPQSQQAGKRGGDIEKLLKDKRNENAVQCGTINTRPFKSKQRGPFPTLKVRKPLAHFVLFCSA